MKTHHSPAGVVVTIVLHDGRVGRVCTERRGRLGVLEAMSIARIWQRWDVGQKFILKANRRRGRR